MRLRNQESFDTFFAAISGDDKDFDVTDLPGRLWPYLYLLDVQQDKLIIRLNGDAIRQTFQRDLRGVDLLSITHGPKADDIKAGYEIALNEHRPVVMRRLIHLKDKNLTKVIECGFAPLMTGTQVKRIIGCLFLDHAEPGDTDFGDEGLVLEKA